MGYIFEYFLILLMGFLGGLPIAAISIRAGHPIFGVIVWLGVFGYAIYAVCDVATFDGKPR